MKKSDLKTGMHFKMSNRDYTRVVLLGTEKLGDTSARVSDYKADDLTRLSDYWELENWDENLKGIRSDLGDITYIYNIYGDLLWSRAEEEAKEKEELFTFPEGLGKVNVQGSKGTNLKLVGGSEMWKEEEEANAKQALTDQCFARIKDIMKPDWLEPKCPLKEEVQHIQIDIDVDTLNDIKEGVENISKRVDVLEGKTTKPTEIDWDSNPVVVLRGRGLEVLVMGQGQNYLDFKGIVLKSGSTGHKLYYVSDGWDKASFTLKQ